MNKMSWKSLEKKRTTYAAPIDSNIIHIFLFTILAQRISQSNRQKCTQKKKISKTPENMRFELEIRQCWTCGVRIEFVMQSAFCSLWLSITCLLVVQHQCFHISMNSSIKKSVGLLSQVFKFWIENYIVSNVIINS